MDMRNVNDLELFAFAYPALIVMVVIVMLLTWVDPEYEGEGPMQAMKWIWSAATAFVVAGIRGYPPQLTAYMGATTLFWISVFPA